jgi:hypothetical protein
MVVSEMALPRQAHHAQGVVTVRAPGARIAPRSKIYACTQTRSEQSGAKGAKTSMIASGRCAIGGVLRPHELGKKLIYGEVPPAPATSNVQSKESIKHIINKVVVNPTFWAKPGCAQGIHALISLRDGAIQGLLVAFGLNVHLVQPTAGANGALPLPPLFFPC